MTIAVLQAFDSQGRLTFDSALCAGGVCLGLYTVPAGGATYTFPDLGPGLTGFALSVIGMGGSWSYDNSLGYPRFTFAFNAGMVALFVR